MSSKKFKLDVHWIVLTWGMFMILLLRFIYFLGAYRPVKTFEAQNIALVCLNHAINSALDIYFIAGLIACCACKTGHAAKIFLGIALLLAVFI